MTRALAAALLFLALGCERQAWVCEDSIEQVPPGVMRSCGSGAQGRIALIEDRVYLSCTCPGHQEVNRAR